MATPQTASGTTNDKQFKSFVESPSRGPNLTAREVFVGNQSGNPVLTFDSRGATKFAENEVMIAAGATQLIVNLTVLPGKVVELLGASLSGENKGIFKCILNGNRLDTARTYYTHFNEKFELNSTKLKATDVVSIEAENTGNVPAFFNATLYYKEYDEP